MSQWRLNSSQVGHCVRLCHHPENECSRCAERDNGHGGSCRPLSWHDNEEQARDALKRHKRERGK